MQRKLLGIIKVDFDATGKLLFRIRKILEKKLEYKETVHQFFIDVKKAYDSFRREVLYNILTEFGNPQETGKANKNVCD